jgi:hypothetical protein
VAVGLVAGIIGGSLGLIGLALVLGLTLNSVSSCSSTSNFCGEANFFHSAWRQ